eukprot:354318-Chlamydomonas_euryale.AAC.11
MARLNDSERSVGRLYRVKHQRTLTLAAATQTHDSTWLCRWLTARRLQRRRIAAVASPCAPEGT